MGIVTDLLSRVKTSLAVDNLYIDANNTTGNNPAVEAAFATVYAPKVGRIDKLEYIKYGQNDDLDRMYDALLYKSDTHSGILTKKAKMVAGNELIVEGEESLAKSELALWLAFKKRCGGLNKSLYNVIKEAAAEYEKSGAVGLDITYDKGFSSIISIRVVPQRNLRCGLPDPKTGDITYFVKRNTGFKRSSSNAIKSTEEKIAAFDTLNEKDLRQLLYIRNPFSCDEFYGVPNYIGAYYFIAADFEFGRSIYNSAKNGFAPKMVATLVGRNLSAEEKRNEAEKFKSNFQGSDGEQVIVAWTKKAEDKPEFKSLDIQNLDKTISVMAQLNDAKILTAHNITSPTLFGIMVSGKLGGTGNELATSYDLFRVTETLPNRELIMSSFQSIIDRTRFVDKLKLQIADVEINFGNQTETKTDNEKDKSIDDSSERNNTKEKEDKQ